MITYSATYSAKIKNSSIDVDWIFDFINDNSGHVYIASKDRNVGGNWYYGIVEDSGEISRDLDLINCLASVGEISISCIDKYKNDTLSSELLHNGSDYYLNQKVTVRECVDNETTLADCPLLYEGRLKEIDIKGNSCVLVIEQWTPFDHIQIPQSVSTLNHVFQPVVYGDYTVNADGSFCASDNLYPAPALQWALVNRYYAVCKTIASNGHCHYWEDKIKKFVPFEDSPETSATQNGLDSNYIDMAGERDFSFWPDGVGAAGNWSDAANMYDGSALTSATITETTTDGDGTETFECTLTIPQFDGVWNEVGGDQLYILIDADLSIDSTSGSPDTTDTYLDVSIDGSTWHNVLTVGAVGSTSTSGAGDVGTGDFDSETIDISAECTSGKYGDYVYVRLRSICTKDPADGSSLTATATVRGMYIRGSLKWQAGTDAGRKALEDTDMVYIGDDGLPRDYTDGNGTATTMLIHEAHRDIMDRFAGVDYDDDYMQNWDAAAPGDYDLSTARSGWAIRLWLLEQVPLKELLEQLQFEGCFIFVLVADADGSGNAGGRYIWVQNSYSSGNVIQTFTEDDYTDLSIGHTDIFEIITKSVYNFDRHPVDNSYRQEDEYDNTTQRDYWNFSTHHEERINLDYLVGSANGTDAIYDGGTSDDTPNESIVLYRDNIQSEPKMLVDFEITNKAKMNVEYGDIIQVNDDNVDPYGETWTNIYFMVISERRNKLTLGITAREVYRS